MEYNYDLAVIGAGPGGYEAALKAAAGGLKTALIEERDIGGTCLNRGCIPTKALLHGSDVFHQAAEAGWLEGEGYEVSYEKLQQYKETVVTKLRGNVEMMLKKAGVTVIRGFGVLKDGHTITVGEQDITASNIILATGSRPAVPPIEGIDGKDIVTSDEFLSQTEYGEHTVIVGGGVIGIELATFLGQLGKKVTVIEMMPSILPGVDDDLIRWLSRGLKALNVTLITSAAVKRFADHEVIYEKDEKEAALSFDQCVVAVGRRVNTERIGAVELGLAMNRAFIVTDEHMKTSVDSIYAIGDITGHQQLAHVATCQGLTAVSNLLGHGETIDYETVPACIYTSPEIACVGKSARQLEGRDILTGRYNVGANGRSLLSGNMNGTIRIYADRDSHRILGCQIMSPGATDMISEVTVLLKKQGTLEDIVSAIHPHPAFAESLKAAARDALEGSK